MIYKQKMGYTLLFSLCISTLSYSRYPTSFIQHSLDKYHQSFPTNPAEKEEDARPINIQSSKEMIMALFKPMNFGVKQLAPSEKRVLVQKASPLQEENSQAVIDQNCVDKMELVYGEGTPTQSLVSYLSKFSTSFSLELGRKRFVEMLTQPTTDTKLITQRQQFIQELVSNEELFKQCKALLEQIGKEAESHVLSFYKEPNSIQKELFPRVYWKAPVSANVLEVNTTISTEIGTRLSNLGTALQIGATPTMVGVGIYKFNALNEFLRRKYGVTIKQVWNFYPSSVRTFYKAYAGFIGGLYVLGSMTALSSARINKNICNYMQEYLIGVATCVNNTRTLSATLERNNAFSGSELAQGLSSITNKKEHGSQFNELINLLQTNTFKGKASFFSYTGRVLRAYKIMENKEVLKEFETVLSALGELDVYVTLAAQIKQSQKQRVHYTFAQFKQGSAPSIQAINFWNPFVGADKAVVNSIEMGGTSAIKDIILTGPNTGGKSTLLKALMVNAILAQTFGIACADQFIITPFAKLMCHMNITDDTAGGVSLFKAEVKRAQELMETMRNLKANEYAFIIIDEIFTGTAPDKAEDLSYKFIKQLSEIPQGLFIDATHFKKLVGLEQETHGVCKNFHMGAIVNADGKVTKYTYTLEKGPSKINNAEQIAQEEGIF